MPSEEEVQQVRDQLIRLLEGEEAEPEGWRIAYETALKPGRQILRTYKGHFGAYAINLFILDLLRSGFPMHAVALGSGRTEYAMTNADGHGLYINKLTIEDDMAIVLSFHVSIHHRSD